MWTRGHLWNGEPTSLGLEIGRNGDSTRSKNSSSHTELLILGVTDCCCSSELASALNRFTWSSNSVELLFCRMSLTWHIVVLNEVDKRVGSHRVEVDLADVVQLVPVGVGLVHHCALQVNLRGEKRSEKKSFISNNDKSELEHLLGEYWISPPGFLCNCPSGRRSRCQPTSGSAAR